MISTDIGIRRTIPILLPSFIKPIFYQAHLYQAHLLSESVSYQWSISAYIYSSLKMHVDVDHVSHVWEKLCRHRAWDSSLMVNCSELFWTVTVTWTVTCNFGYEPHNTVMMYRISFLAFFHIQLASPKHGSQQRQQTSRIGNGISTGVSYPTRIRKGYTPSIGRSHSGASRTYLPHFSWSWDKKQLQKVLSFMEEKATLRWRNTTRGLPLLSYLLTVEEGCFYNRVCLFFNVLVYNLPLALVCENAYFDNDSP